MPHAHRASHADPLHVPHDTAHAAARDAINDARRAFGEPPAPHAPRTTGNAAVANGPSRWLGALLGPLVLTAGLVMTLGTLLTGCGDKTPPGEVAVMRACRICHGTERICADIGKLDRAGWEKTVDRMIAGGANVTPEERIVVIDWLSARKPGDKPLCP